MTYTAITDDATADCIRLAADTGRRIARVVLRQAFTSEWPPARMIAEIDGELDDLRTHLLTSGANEADVECVMREIRLHVAKEGAAFAASVNDEWGRA